MKIYSIPNKYSLPPIIKICKVHQIIYHDPAEMFAKVSCNFTTKCDMHKTNKCYLSELTEAK